MPTDAIDREGLATSISWLLAGTALVVLDVRLSFFGVDAGGVSSLDVLFDPAGAVVVALGVERLRATTPHTTVGTWLRLVAWLHVGLVTVTEAGILLGELAAGGVGTADSADASLTWQLLAAATVATTVIGVVLLARHLRGVLGGIASDRWRQVTIAWVTTLVALPLLLVGALELVFLVLAVAATAGVLLLVALLATRRAAEEDALDRDFEG